MNHKDVLLAYEFKKPVRLSRQGVFNLDLEYPDNRYLDDGVMEMIGLKGDEVWGEIRLNNGVSVDFTERGDIDIL